MIWNCCCNFISAIRSKSLPRGVFMASSHLFSVGFFWFLSKQIYSRVPPFRVTVIKPNWVQPLLWISRNVVRISLKTKQPLLMLLMLVLSIYDWRKSTSNLSVGSTRYTRNGLFSLQMGVMLYSVLPHTESLQLFLSTLWYQAVTLCPTSLQTYATAMIIQSQRDMCYLQGPKGHCGNIPYSHTDPRAT